MKFENENQKRKFVETMLNSGIDEAKRQYITENKKIIIVETGKTVNIMGENLTADQARERYPDTVVIDLTKEETDV